MSRIRHINTVRSALTIGLLLFFLTLIISVPFAIIGLLNNGTIVTAITLIVVLPFAYGVISFVMMLLNFFLYNIVARWTGGIDIELENNE